MSEQLLGTRACGACLWESGLRPGFGSSPSGAGLLGRGLCAERTRSVLLHCRGLRLRWDVKGNWTEANVGGSVRLETVKL